VSLSISYGKRELAQVQNEVPRIVAHRCIIAANIGKHILQAKEATLEQRRGNIVQATKMCMEASIAVSWKQAQIDM
jgi:hypothetical protein